MKYNKLYFALFASALTFSLNAFAGGEDAVSASLKDRLMKDHPGLVIDKVTKAPIADLYQFYDGNSILYTDKKGEMVIAGGSIYNVKTKENLTQRDMKEYTKIDFSALPLADAVKSVKGNGKNVIVVFSDPDCPYCKRLENDVISKLTNHTIYTFFYPLVELHPDAKAKAESVWCSNDKQKAWTDLMLNNVVPPVKSCDNPIARNLELANKLKVRGTPTIFYGDGTREMGAPNVEKMNAM